MTEVIKVIQERTVVVRDAAQVRVIHAGFQGLPGRAGLPGASSGSETMMRARINLGGHRVVFAGGQGLEYGDWNLIDTAHRIVGITTSAVSAGEDAAVRNYGELAEASWNWDISKPVYLGANGLLTQNNPRDTGAAFLLVVGFPTSPTTLFITIRDPIFLS